MDTDKNFLAVIDTEIKAYILGMVLNDPIEEDRKSVV